MNEYYTLGSLLEFGGAVVAVTLVTAVVSYLAGEAIIPYLKWFALATSLVLAYLSAVMAAETDWTKWVVAFFNGLLIFLAATGMNQLAAGKPKVAVAGAPRGALGAAPEPAPKKFWTSWV